MKVSIGYKEITGPWGGGNNFRRDLSEYLKDTNIDVINNLNHRDIDIILLTEPRLTSFSSSFTHRQIYFYKKLINPNVQVVHRVNECDERKNTKFMNQLLTKANLVADYTVFVSSWLKELHFTNEIGRVNSKVILGGANETIFNDDNLIKWDKSEKLKVVTHHWGNDWNKGFDIYNYLDEMIENNPKFKNLEFTYIGNLPENFMFKNSSHINPLSGKDLAKMLKNHHIYITASINEPSGNHHIEAAQCGLPIIYINSGGIVEYCRDYGVLFNNKDDFNEKLLYPYREERLNIILIAFL